MPINNEATIHTQNMRGLVEGYRMQQAMWVLLLVSLKDSRHLLVNVARGFDCSCQIYNSLASLMRLFMVIPDLDVDYVYGLVHFASSGEQIIADRVETTLLAGNDDVSYSFAFLPALWRTLELSISI